jgi:hypothetical protein
VGGAAVFAAWGEPSRPGLPWGNGKGDQIFAPARIGCLCIAGSPQSKYSAPRICRMAAVVTPVYGSRDYSLCRTMGLEVVQTHEIVDPACYRPGDWRACRSTPERWGCSVSLLSARLPGAIEVAVK